MQIRININKQCKKWTSPIVIYRKLFKNLAHNTLTNLNLQDAHYEISVLLTNDQEITVLNKQYRDKNKATDVLSFPSNDAYFLGDIAISFDTMEKDAKEMKKDFEQHLSHLFVHSVLHLLGYDHQKPKEAREMEEMEEKILGCKLY